jgi:hypothetical protein
MRSATLAVALAGILLATPKPTDYLKAIGRRWKLSNEECRQAKAAIVNWSTFRDARSLPWSQVQPLLIDRDADTILAVATAKVVANQFDPSGVELVRDALDWPAERRNPPPLLTGNDLQALGVPAGPAFARILKSLREQQLNGQLHSRDEAIAALPQLL